MPDFAPELCHEPLLDGAPRRLAFTRERDFAAWRAELDAAFRRIVGVLPAPVPLHLRIAWEEAQPAWIERRLVFTAEAGADVPCHLLLPKTGGPFPAAICLQGHTTGMHVSLGRPRTADDAESITLGHEDFAVQAVRQGFAALALEQRAFGEREDQRPRERRSLHNRCHHPSMTALLLGRTLIGERAWDVSRAIDALAALPEVDASRVAVMGNSGGGTVAYYAACLDPRIAVAMPSSSVCTYRHAIGRLDHCHDNYLPGALQYFDMGDLAALIAPRPLIVVAGTRDPIFPLAGVEACYRTIAQIYAAAGVPERCRLIIGDGGHGFYPAQAWPAFHALAGWTS